MLIWLFEWRSDNINSYVQMIKQWRDSASGDTYLSQLKSQECPVGAGVWLAGVHAGCAAWRTVNLDHRPAASPRRSPKYPRESAAAAANTTTAEPPAKPQISFKVFLYDILREGKKNLLLAN